jgi:copper(I)-binding protein
VRRELLRAAAGPVICAVVAIGLLSAWVSAGGAGTLHRVRLEVMLAAVPMRALTLQQDARVGTARTYLNIRNIGSTPDELIAASSPVAARVALTAPDLIIPAHGTLTLSPFGVDLVLERPKMFETSQTVPLVLTFRQAGTMTIDALVTPPGTP